MHCRFAAAAERAAAERPAPKPAPHMTSLIPARSGTTHHGVMSTPNCLVCNNTSDRVPLLTMDYRGGTIRICPQHLPIIIHDPAQLIGLLAGAEELQPSAHHD